MKENFVGRRIFEKRSRQTIDKVTGCLKCIIPIVKRNMSMREYS
jgi:hypothetical protein